MLLRFQLSCSDMKCYGVKPVGVWPHLRLLEIYTLRSSSPILNVAVRINLAQI